LRERIEAFRERLERSGNFEPWKVIQAMDAVRTYFVNYLKNTSWDEASKVTGLDADGYVDGLALAGALRRKLRTLHYSYRTESTYVDWLRRYITYSMRTHATPRARIDAPTIRDFLAHLALRRDVSASTQNQAFHAMLFVCRHVLGLNVEEMNLGVRAKRGDRLPVVMSVTEVRDLIHRMSGTTRLMASLIYGGGLRVSECCRLRVKDIDFDQGLLVVRAGKGDKDRSTLLAESVRDELKRHLRRVYPTYQSDRRLRLAGVFMPFALDRKYPAAGTD
jgi:site-specific recombinase XerD